MFELTKSLIYDLISENQLQKMGGTCYGNLRPVRSGYRDITSLPLLACKGCGFAAQCFCGDPGNNLFLRRCLQQPRALQDKRPTGPPKQPPHYPYLWIWGGFRQLGWMFWGPCNKDHNSILASTLGVPQYLFIPAWKRP